MDTLLILVGLSVFLAGFTLYLKRAFALSRAWGFWCLVFPPLAMLYYWRNWPAAKETALLQLGGLSLAFVGLLFAINSAVDVTDQSTYKMSGEIEPSARHVSQAATVESVLSVNKQTDVSLSEKVKQRVKSTVVELSQTAKRVQKSRELNGALNKQRFKPNSITWSNNSLRFKQGEKLLGDKEVVILLPESRFTINSGSHFVFKPEDVSGPEIHLSWLPQDGSGQGAGESGSESLGGSPIQETRILKSGYTLELAIGMVNETQFSAQILFDYQGADFSSKLAGNFIASNPEAELANTNNTEQMDLEIEPRSRERERLEIGRVESQAQELAALQSVIVSTEPSSAKQPLALSEQEKQDKGNGGDQSEEIHGGATTLPLLAVGTEPTEFVVLEKPNTVEVETKPQLVPHTDILEPYLKPETAAVLQQLAPFWGKVVVMTAVDGSQTEGLLKAIRQNYIALELQVGAGTMEKLTPIAEFKSISLK